MAETEYLIYENLFAKKEDIEDFVLEGKADITFENGCMRMKNALEAGLGQMANFVLWCPKEFPKDIRVEWEFRPLSDVGLCILFFAAAGKGNRDLFDPSLAERTGEYPQYHSGDINAFHVSYFRRKEPEERVFHTCNLRKSCGFYLVAQGADPIPGVEDVVDFYRLAVIKKENRIEFTINEMSIFTYMDDGITCGALLDGGKIGFRQLAPLTAEYRNLRVYQIK